MNRLKLMVKVIDTNGVVTEYQTEKIFAFEGECRRLSGVVDTFKVTYSSNVSDEIKEGFYLLEGYVRRTKTGTYIYATSITEIEEPNDYTNEVELVGVVTKKPRYRVTSKSETSITDICVTVMRNSVKYDTLQCIAWNKYAHFAKDLQEGDKVHVRGRLQSKVYTDGRRSTEVSCINIEKEES